MIGEKLLDLVNEAFLGEDMRNIQIGKHDYGLIGYGYGATIDKEPQVNMFLSC